MIGNITLVPFLRDKRVLISAAVIVLGGLGLGLGLTFTGGGSQSNSGASSRGGLGGNSSTSTTAGRASPSSTASDLPACTLSRLSLSTGSAQTVAGHTGLPVVFKNISSSTCQLTGYPTVVGLNSSGTRVGAALPLPSGFVGGVGPNGTPATVALNPGSSASAEVEASSQPLVSGGRPSAGSQPPGAEKSTTTTAARHTESCPMLATLSVAVPGDATTKSLPVSLTDCYAFSVHPFVKGTSGSG